MTKSNLATHLRWLVKQGPSLYPSLTPSAHETRDDITTRNPAPALPISALGQAGAGSSFGRDSDLDRIPGTIVEDTGSNDADADTNMARLQFAPQSASKPRLLSSSKKPFEGTPKKSLERIPEKSPTAHRGVQPQKDNDYDLPPSSRSFFKKSTTSPIRPKRTSGLDSPALDIDAIDLTGDIELPAAPSSGTLEEFGEPRRLWTADAASRKEPDEKRGKKRKSDEYKSDLLSPRRHAPKVHSPLALSKSAASKDPAPYASPTAHRHAASSPTKQRARTEDRVIRDSDDDGDDGDDDLFDDWMQGDDQILENDDGLYPVLPKENHSDNHEDGRLWESPIRTSAPSFKKDDSPTPVVISPVKRPSPKKQASPERKPTYSSPLPTSSQTPQNENIVKFLEFSVDSLNNAITELKSSLTKNAEIVYQQAMEGVPALELITVNKTLKGRIEAIEQLKQKKIAHKTCQSRKDSLKKSLIRAISEGDDPSTMSELAESRSVSAELGQIEEAMRDLLSRADILDMASNSLASTTPKPSSDRLTSDTGSSAMAFNRAGSPLLVSPAQPTSTNTMSRADISAPATAPLSRTTTDNDVFAVFDYDEPMSEGEDCFTRTMGSPSFPAFEADEFDLDANDEDMFEAAGQFEGNRSPAVDNYASHGRKVFGETSANAVRVPSPDKSPVRAALWNQHSWSMDVKNALKDRFHLRGFRMNQLEAIDATLSGKDTFVLMPTGGGKSLCYQLPSVVSSGTTRGVTIVISPLLSLMQDQVDQLQRLKIKAILLNKDTKKEERTQVLSTLARHGADEHIQLLYITPEMMNKNQVLNRILESLHSRQRLARIVIDEAHCVSQWGHDFRPDYKELGQIRNQLPGIPMMALTATATENVKVDVIHNLKMKGCRVFTQSFNRPNLTYDVRPKPKGAELLNSIENIIKTSYRNQSGIVYCLSRKVCEKVAEALQERGIKAAFYHAGIETAKKAEVQQRWQSGRYNVIVATIAFGMGIDKPDVRFVIHHSIPKSLEGYYQETGRAGRDGKRSGCYLYYSYKDTSMINRMIDSGDGDWAQKERQRQMLRNVVQYSENKSDCRRVQILAYFNEYFRREYCNKSCDNCKSDSVFETRDFSEYASSAIKLVRHFQETLNENVTLQYCVNIFRGSVKRPRSPEHRQIPWNGVGSALELPEAERLFQRLLSEGAFREHNVVNASSFATQYLKVGRRAAEFESGRRDLKLQVRLSPSKATRSTTGTRPSGNDDHPMSTNVSSPVQSASHRRLAKFRHHASKDEDSGSEDSDGFERIRVAGKPRQEKKRSLGPPITDDGDFSRLDQLHQAVAEDFMYFAKQTCQQIMMEKGLRNQPFTDGILRKVAIRLPKDLSELAAIPGIDTDKVSRYGKKILEYAKNTRRRLAELKKDGEDADGIVADPNHTNVINLDSDNEFGGDDIFEDQTSSLFDLDEGNTVSSRFFPEQPPLAHDSSDEFHDAVSEQSGPKPRKRQSGKRSRRKTPSGSGFKAKGSRSKTPKSGDGTSNRSSSSRKPTKAKSSNSAPRIPTMPT